MKIYNEIITIFNDETQKWETLYEDSYSQQDRKGGHQLLPCRENFWGIVEWCNRVLWTQGVKEMCFKNVFEGKSHTEQLHANIEF